ncbi:MAG: hypothetical protein FWG70_01780 [Oscillospiraceae bacterium]|nr:hypothetical protein [Oscillospiraceae bacterium]
MGKLVSYQNAPSLGRGLKTAFHIIRGDNVCPLENNFLFDKYPWMYVRAWSLRAEEGEESKGTLHDDLMEFIDSGIFDMSRETMMEALGVSA